MYYNYSDLDFLNEELSAIWPGWTAIKLLGKGGFGAVYEIHRTIRRNKIMSLDADPIAQDNDYVSTAPETVKLVRDSLDLNDEALPSHPDSREAVVEITEKAALKVLRVPESDLEIDQIALQGMSRENTDQFYEKQVADIRNEIKIMQKFVGNSHLVSYEDYVIRKRPDNIGWDIYIRMELLTALPDYAEQHPLDEQTTMKLALDISKGLRDCHQNGIIHRDIKPQNIFVTEEGRFKLGDFGLSRAIPGTQSVLSFKGTPAYMAPEVYRMASTDARSDIYSLGIVLYQCLNDNLLPFVSETEMITPESIETAKLRRLNGEAVPVPAHGSPDLQSIVVKSMAFHPEDRFQTAGEMYNALSAVSHGESISLESGILPQTPVKTETTTALKTTALPRTEAEPAGKSRKSKRPVSLIAVSIVLAAIIVGAIGGIWFVGKMKSSFSPSASTGSTLTDASAAAAATDAASIDAAASADTAAVAAEAAADAAAAGEAVNNADGTGSLDADSMQNLNADEETDTVEDYPIEWNDEILEGKMREITGIYDEDIYYSDVKDLTKLDLRDDNGTTMVFGPIKDISALACMTKLEKLLLEFGEVTDISPLRGMKNMKELSLGYNQITDISPLAGMTQMEELILAGNKISDISALSGMKNLTGLWVYECEISDISALSEMTKLESLYINENKISDISAVENMTRMKKLVIFENNISDISSVHRMTNLELLNAWGNKISDISIVGNFLMLNYLDLGTNEISDISPLRSIPYLQNLLIYDNNITDISVLREMDGFNLLNIENNPIEDYSPLDDISVKQLFK